MLLRPRPQAEPLCLRARIEVRRKGRHDLRREAGGRRWAHRSQRLQSAFERAFHAGADIILYPPDVKEAYEALLEAARSNQISEERLNASVRRILTAKARLDLHHDKLTDVAKLHELVAREESSELAQQIIDPFRSVELELSRELQVLLAKENIRSAQEEEIPEGYKKLVEEYYKKLSNQKSN